MYSDNRKDKSVVVYLSNGMLYNRGVEIQVYIPTLVNVRNIMFSEKKTDYKMKHIEWFNLHNG